MKKLAALITVLLIAVIAGVSTADAKDKHPVYQTPKCVNAQVFDTAQVSLTWCDVPYADFYTVRLSKFKTMKDSSYSSETAPGEIGTILNGLDLNTTYWATVTVTTSRGEVLSNVSKRICFHTPTVAEVAE